MRYYCPVLRSQTWEYRGRALTGEILERHHKTVRLIWLRVSVHTKIGPRIEPCSSAHVVRRTGCSGERLFCSHSSGWSSVEWSQQRRSHVGWFDLVQLVHNLISPLYGSCQVHKRLCFLCTVNMMVITPGKYCPRINIKQYTSIYWHQFKSCLCVI